mgnify:CR=1 FL=1
MMKFYKATVNLTVFPALNADENVAFLTIAAISNRIACLLSDVNAIV